MKSFNQYITEAPDIISDEKALGIIKSIKNAADFKKHFQKIFFGTKKGKEKDTELEAYFAFALSDWVGMGTRMLRELKTPFIQILDLLYEYRNTYKKDLVPSEKRVYRGISDNYMPTIATITGKVGKNWKKISKLGLIVTDGYHYTPWSKAESWSTSLHTATGFSLQHGISPEPIDELVKRFDKKINTSIEKAAVKTAGMWNEDEGVFEIEATGVSVRVKSMEEFKNKYPEAFMRYVFLEVWDATYLTTPIVYEVKTNDAQFVFDNDLLNMFALKNVGIEDETILYSPKRKNYKARVFLPATLYDVVYGDLFTSRVNKVMKNR